MGGRLWVRPFWAFKTMISVIVATYNQETTIARTLDSILMQQCHEPIEIVIGEDCSTDGTLAVCRQYAQRYPDKILLLANTRNKGVIDNYFDCIFAAHGEYIADCAGDDFWTDNRKLEKELDILEQHPDVGIVHTDWQYFDGTHTTPAPAAHHTQHITDGKTLLTDILTPARRPVIHLCTALYRTAWIRKAHNEHTHLFRNKRYGCEDVQVAYYLAKMGNVAYIPDITLSYSREGESISNSTDHERLFRFYSNTGQLTFDIAKEEHIADNPHITEYLRFRIYELMMYAFRSGNSHLRREALSLSRQWGITINRSTAIIKLITSTTITWHSALLLRRIVKHTI